MNCEVAHQWCLVSPEIFKVLRQNVIAFRDGNIKNLNVDMRCRLPGYFTIHCSLFIILFPAKFGKRRSCLHGMEIKEATLTGSVFTNAKLAGAKFDDAIMPNGKVFDKSLPLEEQIK